MQAAAYTQLKSANNNVQQLLDQTWQFSIYTLCIDVREMLEAFGLYQEENHIDIIFP